MYTSDRFLNLPHLVIASGEIMQASAIGQVFLEYYQQNGFSVLPRASLLDPSIPMSFVMSAGLVQVESAINRVGRTAGDKYVLLQKCFRHFDVETVGTDNRHLSFFEMPGAFTFGEMSREIVVQQMWSLITEALQLDPHHLWVSYFAGGEKSGHYFSADEATRQAWLEIGVSPDRLVGLDAQHNLWIQGKGLDDVKANRKCGPNTEIFWDHGQVYACGLFCHPGCSCGRFTEIANSLFIYQQIDNDGNVRSLDTPYSETVIGAERVAMLIQEKASVFELDVFSPLIATIQSFLDSQANGGLKYQQQICIIADHLRALLFLVADGAPPPWGASGEKGSGRHRLIRILMRRVLTAQILLGIQKSDFLDATLDVVIRANYESQLEQAKPKLLVYFARENERFTATLRKGCARLARLQADCQGLELSESQVADIEKKYGMPRTLIEQELTARGVKRDSLLFNENIVPTWGSQFVSQPQIVS